MESYKNLVSSRPKSLIMRPRHQDRRKYKPSIEPGGKSGETAVELCTEEILPMPSNGPTTGSEDAINFLSPEMISGEDRTIQIDLLNLDNIERFCHVRRKNGLPQWQYSACDVLSGGVWIAFADKVSSELVGNFMEAVAGYMAESGITLGDFKIDLNREIELGPNQGIAGRPGLQIKASKYFAHLNESGGQCTLHKSAVSRFHRQIVEDFYSVIKVRNGKNFISQVYSYMLEYNYGSRNDMTFSVPPYQLISRRENGRCSPGLFSYQPVILKERSDRIRQCLGRFRFIADSVSGLVGTIGRRKKEATGCVPRSVESSPAASTVSKQKSFKPEANYEYIDLRNVAWKKSGAENERAGNGSRLRNRREMINRAKKLLEQKTSIAELRQMLPITEGELSMLNRNIMHQKEVRNI